MNADKVKVSVIMPTYNSEKYLSEAIGSLLAQTFKNFELLIVDDNSGDNTVSIIESYKDSRIKLISGSCNGLAAALNTGIAVAQGEYIARMDSDDIAMPERLSKQVSFLDNNLEYGVCGTRCTSFDDKRDYGIYGARHVERPGLIDQLVCSVVAHTAVMFRKDVFEYYGLKYDESCDGCEDQELWSRALRNIKFYNIQEPMMKYRRRISSASKTNKDAGTQSLIEIKHSILSQLFPTATFYRETLDEQISYIVEAFLVNETHEYRDSVIKLLNLNKKPQKLFVDINDIASDENYKKTIEELRLIKKSLSYRLGRCITFAPRKIVRGLMCVRDHGFCYTIRLSAKKIFGNLEVDR